MTIKQKVQFHAIGRRLKTKPALLLAVGLLLAGSAVPIVRADQYTQQIQDLQSQDSQAQSTVNSLQAQATSYQDAINQLQSQIASLQQNIQNNENTQASLQQQIQTAQGKLNTQKQVLGDDIKAMYVGGQMSTVEELATSKNLSDFVDAETYRSAVEGKIQTTLTKITNLQNTLNDKQQQVQQAIQAETGQQTQLAADQQKQNGLLALNQQQQAAYTQTIQANNAKISQLQQDEIAANESGVEGSSSGGGPCGGTASATYAGVTYTYPDTYPSGLCSIPQDSVTDQWGLLNRECVSYTAWMEASTGHSVPYGLGDATNWPSNVPSSWVSSTPQVGDIAIRPAIPGLTIDGESDVGHAMYVEKVLNSDTIVVSEYNEDLNGDFSVQVRSTDAPYNGYTDNLVFINFPSN